MHKSNAYTYGTLVQNDDEAYKRDKLKKEKPYVYQKILKFDEKIRLGESIAIIQFQYNFIELY